MVSKGVKFLPRPELVRCGQLGTVWPGKLLGAQTTVYDLPPERRMTTIPHPLTPITESSQYRLDTQPYNDQHHSAGWWLKEKMQTQKSI